MNVRAVPWLLALGGLGVWLVGSGSAAWASVVAWLITLTVGWAVVSRYRYPLTRAQRVALAILLLPILAFTGGWWLVPADLAWLALELLEPVVGRQQRQA
jgi:hypothetical protein